MWNALDLHTFCIDVNQFYLTVPLNVVYNCFYIFFYFFYKILADTCPFLGATGTPGLDFWWHLLWVSKPEWVLSFSLFAKVNVMYIPQDPPLVLHMTTSWQLSSPPVLSPHTVAEVRLPRFELMFSEYLRVRRSTTWAKPGPTCFYILGLKSFIKLQVTID